MEKLFIYLTNLSSHSAYLIVFGILVACGIGFPIPEDIPLVATGYLCWDGTVEWIPALVVTILGVLAGDTLLYVFGRKIGIRLLEKESLQNFFTPTKVRRTRAYFRKYGDKIVFIARFVAGFRAAAFFMAGSLKMKYRRFLLFDLAAALISVPLWIALGFGLGHYLGDEISKILQSLHHFKTGITTLGVAIISLLVIRAFLKYYRLKHQNS